MILILTTNEGDHSHEKFVDWLEYYNADFIILTGEDIYYNNREVLVKNGELFIDSINLSKKVNVVFNRRWLTIDKLKQKNDFKFNKIVVDELYELRNFLKTSLKNAIFFPDIDKIKVNKLDVLYQAKINGLLTPDYIITNNKDSLRNFIQKHKQVITKAIGNFGFIEIGNTLINPVYTKIIDTELLNILPKSFCLSFFQKLIQKKHEYRVMYFNQKIYTVKLLTQENDFSTYDSRIATNNQDIRITKSILPLKIEEKIINLMDCLKLNIGSLDLIEDLNGDFYFLEVNPVGQIGGYSTRTNSTFEKDIVLEMIKIDEKKNKSNDY